MPPGSSWSTHRCRGCCSWVFSYGVGLATTVCRSGRTLTSRSESQWPSVRGGRYAQQVEQFVTRPIEECCCREQDDHPGTASDYGVPLRLPPRRGVRVCAARRECIRRQKAIQRHQSKAKRAKTTTAARCRSDLVPERLRDNCCTHADHPPASPQGRPVRDQYSSEEIQSAI